MTQPQIVNPFVNSLMQERQAAADLRNHREREAWARSYEAMLKELGTEMADALGLPPTLDYRQSVQLKSQLIEDGAMPIPLWLFGTEPSAFGASNMSCGFFVICDSSNERLTLPASKTGVGLWLWQRHAHRKEKMQELAQSAEKAFWGFDRQAEHMVTWAADFVAQQRRVFDAQVDEKARAAKEKEAVEQAAREQAREVAKRVWGDYETLVKQTSSRLNQYRLDVLAWAESETKRLFEPWHCYVTRYVPEGNTKIVVQHVFNEEDGEPSWQLPSLTETRVFRFEPESGKYNTTLDGKSIRCGNILDVECVAYHMPPPCDQIVPHYLQAYPHMHAAGLLVNYSPFGEKPVAPPPMPKLFSESWLNYAERHGADSGLWPERDES